MDIRPLTAASIEDFERLMSCTPSSDHCRCMWFIKSVKLFHADGKVGNRKDFAELVNTADLPAGVLAYDGMEPVGWCACGPRSRYARAILTPTYHGRDPSEDHEVWLIPCLFIHPKTRGQLITRDLVEQAVELAKMSEAKAIEAFPYAGAKRQSRDPQVGFASVFEAAGFTVARSPSPSRVIMRLDL